MDAGDLELSMIIAASENNVIGRDGQLPWHIGSDLRRFKRLTMGHPIIMGRKTFESLGRVLPGRLHLIVTRNADWRPNVSQQEQDQVKVLGSWAEIEQWLQQSGTEKAFVIGGAQLFEAAIDDVSHFYLTRVHAEVSGDVYLPRIDWQQWELTQRADHPADERNDHAYSFEDYRRVSRGNDPTG